MVTSIRRFNIPKPSEVFNSQLFIQTNEEGVANTLKIFKQQPISGNTILGVGCFFTLDIASIRGDECKTNNDSIRNIIILSQGGREESFWNDASKIIKETDTRLEVISKIKELLKENASRYFDTIFDNVEPIAQEECERLDHAIDEGISWLSNDTRFAKIKRIFDENKFIFQSADLFSANAMKMLNKEIKKEGIVLDTVYLSTMYKVLAHSCHIGGGRCSFFLLDRVTRSNPEAYYERDGIFTQKTKYIKAMEAIINDEKTLIVGAPLFNDPTLYVQRRGPFFMEQMICPRTKKDIQASVVSLEKNDLLFKVASLVGAISILYLTIPKDVF